MGVVKVIELLAQSEKSWEDAAQNAVDKASESIKNIESVNIQNLGATVKDGKIQKYRVNVKLSFTVD
ncbi:MAG: dodecin family protein [Saprospiraceae bacterium]|nr:dodecin family protein [Saprospiraceae bacterium]